MSLLLKQEQPFGLKLVVGEHCCIQHIKPGQATRFACQRTLYAAMKLKQRIAPSCTQSPQLEGLCWTWIDTAAHATWVQVHLRKQGPTSLPAYQMSTRRVPDEYQTHTKCISNEYQMHTRRVQNAYQMRIRYIPDAYQMHTRCVSNAYHLTYDGHQEWGRIDNIR